MPPLICSSKSGVRTLKSPIFDPFGQPAPGGVKAVSAAYWEGWQPISPAPREGLIVTPAGSETIAVLVWAGARAEGCRKPLLSFESLNSKPLAEEAFWSVRMPSDSGEKERLAQADSLTGLPLESCCTAWALTSAGCCQESARAVKVIGPSQTAGRVR